MDTKKYVLTLTKDYVDGFIVGVMTMIVINIYRKNSKNQKRGEV